MANNKIRSLMVACVASVFISGCATMTPHPKDPFESFNRAMFSVNEGVDVVLKPVAQGYESAVPDLVRTGVGNFFGNIADVWTSLNNLLQGKPLVAISDFARVMANTTFGVLGVFDVATSFGIEKHSEDFGQTLAVWGVGDGPYFFWPVIGPRMARDTLGWGVDAYVDPVLNADPVPVRNTLTGVRLVDTRASLLPADKVVEEAAFDKYSYIRNAYFQNRRNEIYDGNPPKERDEE